MDWRGPATEKRSSSFESGVPISCVPGRSRIPNRILRQLKTEPLVFQVLLHLLMKSRRKSAAAGLLFSSKYKICPSLQVFLMQSSVSTACAAASPYKKIVFWQMSKKAGATVLSLFSL